MFFYMLAPIMMINWILLIAAIVPAVYLMAEVYKSDRIEKESGYLLRRLVVVGVLATLLAQVEERVGEWLLRCFVTPYSTLYNVILYFGIVALAEETSKFIMMHERTWDDPEFNCQYDGVVYAVFVSLGFALWENISYVLTYGFSTALVRAVTAVPGHACFGVFMATTPRRWATARWRSRRRRCCTAHTTTSRRWSRCAAAGCSWRLSR